MAARTAVLIGVGSPYVYEAAESLRRDGWSIASFLDNQNKGDGPTDLGRVCNLADAEPELRAHAAFVPLLTPGFRAQIVAQARAAGFETFPAQVDPTAVIASNAQLEDGV